ncbi:MAG: 4-hydroxy-3-methylbut-2-enyl diphosphate reductase [Dehalococcoidia bacterium]|nr:4-hydroxy-3-methylbut-2-enyl diphosphate reductase [Dehalococcoidia bacterium]
MEIEKALEMGFCFGVRRAIDLVERAAGEKGPLQTLGALVHNRQVVDRLASCGVSMAASLDEVHGNIVAIASHGVGPEIMEQVQARGLEVVDATCPFVRKAQVVARKMGEAGFGVLVFGDADHPEVRGVLGYAGGKASATLEIPDLDTLPSRLGILCQTTQNPQHFAEFLTRFISSKVTRFSELRICNTICDATSGHQAAALELAARVDLMFVVGSQDSANTRRLARICAYTGVVTFHIETASDIDAEWLRGHNRVGITAGASTPDEVIDEVVALLNMHVSRN